MVRAFFRKGREGGAAAIWLLGAALLCLWPGRLLAAPGEFDPAMLASVREEMYVYAAMTRTSNVVGMLRKGDAVVVDFALTGSSGAWCCVTKMRGGVTHGYVPCDVLELRSTQLSRWMDRAAAPGARARGGLGDELERALAGEGLDGLKALLEMGADPNETIEGTRPLIVASKSYLKGNVETVRLLLASGADVGARDSAGKSALWHVYREIDYHSRLADGFRTKGGSDEGSKEVERGLRAIIERYWEIAHMLEKAGAAD